MKQSMRNTILLALAGLILIALSIRTMPYFLAFANQEAQRSRGAMILFFNDGDPCECMQELVQQADDQIERWTTTSDPGLPVVHIAMQQRTDLEAKYKIFRAPSLVLVDEQDQVIWRQDYPLMEGEPFKLQDLENAIRKLSGQEP